MKNMKYDIVALGELLVDFSQRSINQKGNPIMEVSPGGHLVIFYQWLRNLEVNVRLLVKWEMITLAVNFGKV